MSLAVGPRRGLLDTLIAVRLDLRHALLQSDGCPVEVSTSIGRMFDDLDASIKKLIDAIAVRRQQ
ncbi:MAG: hypothetical protein M3023_04020 [Pseudomonadota bacterium]|nr:hypothetical protein [Pseudomonadota bacterium]